MSRGPDLARRELWRRRLRQYERSNLTIADFCDGAGVSTGRTHAQISSGFIRVCRLQSVVFLLLRHRERNGEPGSSGREWHYTAGLRDQLRDAARRVAEQSRANLKAGH